ncbi:MAG: FAD-binding protein [Rhodoferax sp.]|uniref:electron transfer flavoprotein subunit alpha/FixB family protein n=1 Tax=Rhodoferax sp. TaxID=50421 RepID=UPI00262AAB94|nr:FAD-binding protein [Rhodoferax sp.]MDD2881691.1 FAD-binding protein [Rhodoferax sp.]
MTTLVIAEHDGAQIDPSTLNLLGAASQIGDPVQLLVLGHDCAAVAQAAAALAGVSQVLLADNPQWVTPSAETLARQIEALMPAYDLLVAAHKMLHRGALPRAAARLRAAYLSDVVAIESAHRFVRPMYAGSVLARMETQSAMTLLTLRPTGFAPAVGTQGACPVVDVATVTPDHRSRLENRETMGSDRPDLSRARVVVAAGRGVGAREHMALIEQLADHLGGAVGASRAAVDAGFAPNAIQIGQTGKSVAPDVYLAFGISGAIQHLAGIKDAGFIVAVNKDPDAPIFSIADVGFVGDLFDVLPALTAGLPAAVDTA